MSDRIANLGRELPEPIETTLDWGGRGKAPRNIRITHVAVEITTYGVHLSVQATNIKKDGSDGITDWRDVGDTPYGTGTGPSDLLALAGVTWSDIEEAMDKYWAKTQATVKTSYQRYFGIEITP